MITRNDMRIMLKIDRQLQTEFSERHKQVDFRVSNPPAGVTGVR